METREEVTGFESIEIDYEEVASDSKNHKNKTRAGRGFQKLVGRAGQMSNLFIQDLKEVAAFQK